MAHKTSVRTQVVIHAGLVPRPHPEGEGSGHISWDLLKFSLSNHTTNHIRKAVYVGGSAKFLSNFTYNPKIFGCGLETRLLYYAL